MRRYRGAKPPVRPHAVWEDKAGRRFNALVIAPRVVLGAGPASEEGSFLSAIRIRDGSNVWTQRLPGAVVRNGLAVDAKGRIFVTTEDGRTLCFCQEGGGS
jgi:outer membrane protein assembly factor BamB